MGHSKYQQKVAGPLNPLGYQKISSVATATGLTVPEGATLALIIAEGGSVRWRDDGTDPISTDGMLLTEELDFMYIGDLDAIKFIDAGSTATLHVAYY